MKRGITWIPKAVALGVHREQLRRHGGDAGIRDEGRLESALARPRNVLSYFPAAPLEELAASLAVGIAKGHPFVDGNKRTAAVMSLLFLRLNGREIFATEDEIAEMFVAVADSSMPEEQLAYWFTESGVPPN